MLVTILKIVVLAGAGLFLLLVGLLVFVALWPAPHQQAQTCPVCGRRARPWSERLEECGGARSYTDALHVTYSCRKGHHFTKAWTCASSW